MSQVAAIPNAVTVREAGESDLAAVLALYAQPGLDDGQVLGIEEARRVFARFSLYPDYHLYVAVLDGTVVGTFALLIMDNLAHLGTPSGVVEDVVVAAECRSQGIGRRMMEFARALRRTRLLQAGALQQPQARARAPVLR